MDDERLCVLLSVGPVAVPAVQTLLGCAGVAGGLPCDEGRIGGLIESSLAAFPAEANISEFGAKTPVMTLYCFIFGMAAFAAVRENKQFLYGAFCILLAVLTNFQRAGFECVFTVLVLLAVQNPQGVGLAENQKFAQAVDLWGRAAFGCTWPTRWCWSCCPTPRWAAQPRGCASPGYMPSA